MHFIGAIVFGGYLLFSIVLVVAIFARWQKRMQMCRIWGGWTVAVIILMIMLLPQISGEKKPISEVATSTDPSPVQQVKSDPVIDIRKESETRAEYVKATKLIGGREDGIYLRAFTKNPDKYAGQRVRISVKIFKIEEQAGKTLMNVYLSRDYEPAIVYYDGEADIYDGDVIMVYGEVIGRLEGENALGATMTWPTIHARYIKKLKYEE